MVEEMVMARFYPGCRASLSLLERRTAPQKQASLPYRDWQPSHQVQVAVVKIQRVHPDYSTSLNLVLPKRAVKTGYPASGLNLGAALKVQKIVLTKPPDHEANLDLPPLSEERNRRKNPGYLANPNRLDLAPE